ncbi:MAG: hypothetical protein JRG68_00465 [Deltaproteobacteria bacterium]|nr:hypothetical protein [Deltaproteobacteria bacterium]
MDIDFNLNGKDLYKEESYTDLKVGAIRSLTPVNQDGSLDESRDPIFMGQTQLMSPNGPLPVSCMIDAKSMSVAIEKFPEAIKQEVEGLIAKAQEAKEKESSRIIVPGQGM